MKEGFLREKQGKLLKMIFKLCTIHFQFFEITGCLFLEMSVRISRGDNMEQIYLASTGVRDNQKSRVLTKGFADVN